MHVPIETAREARDEARAARRRLRGRDRRRLDHRPRQGDRARLSGLPILAIPTTYAGSEMTPIYGLTEGGVKKTGRDPRVLPRDRDLRPRADADAAARPDASPAASTRSRTRPKASTRTTATRSSSLMAEEGIRALGRRAAARCRATPHDLEARSDALYGAWLCGTVLGNVGDGACTTSCATRSAALQPAACARRTPSCCRMRLPTTRPRRPTRWAHRARHRAGAASAPRALCTTSRASNGAPVALRDIGMPARRPRPRRRPRGAEPVPEPAPARARGLRELLQRAWEGTRPD